MSAIWLLVLVPSLSADAPQVEVATLAGPVQSGTLTELSAERLTLLHNQQPQTLPVPNVLELRLPGAVEPTPLPGTITVTLVDGARVSASRITASARELQLEHPQLGKLSIPRNQVRSLRLADDDPAVSAAWTQLVSREARDDLIVIRKGDVLDHVDGVVGAIDDASVKFLLDGDDVSVKRERVFGIIYANRETKPNPTTVRLELIGGDILFVPHVGFREARWEFPWLGKVTVQAPASAVRLIDFSAGKVLFLSQVEPREVEEVPYFSTMLHYQRNRNIVGRPLRIGARSFTRGLAIHSKTRLRYRLGGDYRRLTAEVGLDPELPAGDALLKIMGDGKTLFEANVSVVDEPQTVDVSVEGVVELDILVDYGRDGLDIGDRVHLGDVKVTK